MSSASHFGQLAHLITVGDICSPFIATLDAKRSVADVFVEWGVDLCAERHLDPMEQIALVETDGKIGGWIGYDMLEAGKTIRQCMDEIVPDAILTADTSILEAVSTFFASTLPFFLVLRGNHFVGWLSYGDMHKPPLRLCLFAMLINLERLLLAALLKTPQEATSRMSAGRLNKAREIYRLRQYGVDRAGEPYASKLLECTTLADKFAIASKTRALTAGIPALLHKKGRSAAEELRNELAHPGMEEGSSKLLTRESLWPFIQWAEELTKELGKLTEGMIP